MSNFYIKNEKIFLVAISLVPIFLIFSKFITEFIIVLGSLFFLYFIIKNKKYYLFNDKIFKIIISFTCFIILSALVSEYRADIFFKSTAYIRFAFVYLLIKYLNENNKNFKKYFFISLIISFVILSIDATYQYINGFNLLNYKPPAFRITSFFKDESILGSYIVRLFPIFLVFLYIYRMQLISLISSIILILVVLISGERTALYMFIIIICFYIWYIEIKLKTKLIYALIILASFFILISNKPTLKARLIEQTLDQLSFSKSESIYFEKKSDGKWMAFVKEEYWLPLKYALMFKTSIKIFRENVFFGSGPKTFPLACKDKRYFTQDSYEFVIKEREKNANFFYEGFSDLNGCSTHPHNIILQLLAETGLINTVIFLYFYFYLVFNFFKNKKFTNKFVILAFLISFFPLSFSGSFFNNWINIIAYSSLGFIKKNEM